MKIGMVFYDLQEFGGLEEYATNLAAGLRDQGHQVCALSFAWVPPENQYARRLKAHGIPLFQAPAWISKPVSDWQTKEAILRVVMRLLSPLTLLAGLGLSALRRRPYGQAQNSAYHWLRRRLMEKIIGPDRRKGLGRLLLSWLRLFWKPDLLHVHGFTTSLMFALEWAHAHHLPVIYEEHATPDPQFGAWKDSLESINKASRVIAVSERSARALREVCSVTRPISVAGPLLADPFGAGWQKDIREFDPGRPFIVTTVARLHAAKGLPHLLEAAAIVRQQVPNILFRVYGEGELRSELLDQAARLGLTGDEVFQGTYSDKDGLARVLEETDIFLLPSLLEGQPVVIVEALAHGCPIIATRVGGIPEVIQDGVNGLLCPPGDPQVLASLVLCLARDMDLRLRLSRAARATYETGPFQIQAVSNEFVTVYQEVLAGE